MIDYQDWINEFKKLNVTITDLANALKINEIRLYKAKIGEGILTSDEELKIIAYWGYLINENYKYKKMEQAA